MALSPSTDEAFDRDELHQLYRNAQCREIVGEDNDRKRLELDHIPPGIIGAAKVSDIVTLLNNRRSAGTPFMGSWSVPLEYLTGARVAPAVPASQQKKLPHVSVLNSFRLLHFDEVDKAGLVEEYSGFIEAECGMFTVPKKNGTLRVIFDARPANVRLEPVPASLVLFSLEDVVRVWARLSRRGCFYMVNVDYRHYYYQLPMPEWLKAYMVIKA
eukprot:CAMPEP_0174855822 /NCGR_PEP_ID=MMETSP1114-20130205/34319_1 /TAXON_ID=312471 /ORGANISM="Neobodo designis, Strain CCAP 1951/1" /LENGTH=213 /DNA_ID=CAMNT_0016090589 /DNA_START=55 /DNA_END=692 /DNA_ORIENTATION=-